MDAFSDLGAIVTINHGGHGASAVIKAPAFADEVVRAFFAQAIAVGFHSDNLLNAMENLLQEFRGDVFIIEDGDEE
jgi:glycerol-3-phosphate dehydrogenase